MIFFTSDQHFGHANIIKYCDRPFVDTDEMEEVMISNWNGVVGFHDVVYCVGDFSMTLVEMERVTKRLNGHKILIVGNHDHCHPSHKKSSTSEKREAMIQKYIDSGWNEVKICDSIKIGGESVQISHFPFRKHVFKEKHKSFSLSDDGGWLICGHVHEKWKTKEKMINVGVDIWNFTPVSMEAIEEVIKKGEDCG